MTRCILWYDIIAKRINATRLWGNSPRPFVMQRRVQCQGNLKSRVPFRDVPVLQTVGTARNTQRLWTIGTTSTKDRMTLPSVTVMLGGTFVTDISKQTLCVRSVWRTENLLPPPRCITFFPWARVEHTKKITWCRFANLVTHEFLLNQEIDGRKNKITAGVVKSPGPKS